MSVSTCKVKADWVIADGCWDIVRRDGRMFLHVNDRDVKAVLELKDVDYQLCAENGDLIVAFEFPMQRLA